jgi:hypothetical protein
MHPSPLSFVVSLGLMLTPLSCDESKPAPTEKSDAKAAGAKADAVEPNPPADVTPKPVEAPPEDPAAHGDGDGEPEVGPSPEAKATPEPGAKAESCDDVSGECMEGCEEGWVQYQGTLTTACYDSVCCVRNAAG